MPVHIRTYVVEGLGSFADYHQAKNAALRRAEQTGEYVVVTACNDGEEWRSIVCNPQGQVRKLWMNDTWKEWWV